MSARWNAVVEYRTENGLTDVTHDIEELDELHDLVERGPDWDSIERIVITRGETPFPGLTVEASMADDRFGCGSPESEG